MFILEALIPGPDKLISTQILTDQVDKDAGAVGVALQQAAADLERLSGLMGTIHKQMLRD